MQCSHATNAVYIKENFTHSRRKLFAKVRKFKKDNHWHRPWTLDGKKSQEEQPKIIHAEGDLTKIS